MRTLTFEAGRCQVSRTVGWTTWYQKSCATCDDATLSEPSRFWLRPAGQVSHSLAEGTERHLSER